MDSIAARSGMPLRTSCSRWVWTLKLIMPRHTDAAIKTAKSVTHMANTPSTEENVR
jgi:hypothetical protein